MSDDSDKCMKKCAMLFPKVRSDLLVSMVAALSSPARTQLSEAPTLHVRCAASLSLTHAHLTIAPIEKSMLVWRAAIPSSFDKKYTSSAR